jgi:hypothetical protein
MREMRAIAFVTKLIDDGKIDSSQYKRVNVHWIEAERQMRGIGRRASSMRAWPAVPEGDRPRGRQPSIIISTQLASVRPSM